jgi:hypothetical protein
MSNRGKGGLPVTHFRFVYNYHPNGDPAALVYGEWTPVSMSRSLFPNAEYKDRLSHVEFKELVPKHRVSVYASDMEGEDE